MSLPAKPTDFTLAEARDAVATKKISSKELTAAFSKAVAVAKSLNAAGKQFGKLAGEVRVARQKAEDIGKALT